jgi:hypothetical protein
LNCDFGKPFNIPGIASKSIINFAILLCNQNDLKKQFLCFIHTGFSGTLKAAWNVKFVGFNDTNIGNTRQNEDNQLGLFFQ